MFKNKETEIDQKGTCSVSVKSKKDIMMNYIKEIDDITIGKREGLDNFLNMIEIMSSNGIIAPEEAGEEVSVIGDADYGTIAPACLVAINDDDNSVQTAYCLDYMSINKGLRFGTLDEEGYLIDIGPAIIPYFTGPSNGGPTHLVVPLKNPAAIEDSINILDKLSNNLISNNGNCSGFVPR